MYVTQALHRNAQQQPDNPATIFGDRVRTHRESIDRVARLASGLVGLGVGSGDRVAILSLNSDYFHEILCAIPWADGVIVPVNVRWSVSEIAYSLDEAEVRTIVVDETFKGLVPALKDACEGLDNVIYCGDDDVPDDMVSLEELIGGSEPVEDAHRSGDDLAALFYTGGTTGTPKGVMLSHRNLMTSAIGASTYSWLPHRGRLLHAAPMFHLADLAAWTAGSALGNCHVMIPAFAPVVVLEAIEQHQVDAVLLVPTMIQMLVDDPHVGDYDLSSVTRVDYGASPISDALLSRARKVFPQAQFCQLYGMTEVSPIATILPDVDHSDPKRSRSAGIAAPHSLVKIVDAEDNEVERGVVGEICVSGDHVMLGYWKKPDETAHALRGGWMHTGDGGYMDEDGYVYIADRIKDMIITGGENVYSIEVENVVARHPSVAACAVIGVPDEEWGERVHTVVILLPGKELTLEELRDHCRSEIAGYKCPRSLDIVEEFPMSGAGKILKRELRRQYNA